MPKHKKTVSFTFPDWVDKLHPIRDMCLRSVAEDVYVAKALAESYGATTNPNCVQTMRAAEKSVKKFEDPKTSAGKRCAEGDRAARKFWEAKVCARAKTT
jgi:hypothetical protein